MGTPISVFKEHIYEVINQNHPRPSKIEEFYSAIENSIEFDEHDLTPPTLRGKHVSGDLNWRRNTRNALQSEKDALRLVNINEGIWALPRELSSYEEIDVENSWDLIRDAAKHHLNSGIEFSSWIQSQRYKISNVSDSSIVVERLDSNKPVNITPGQIERAIQRLNAAGGSSGRRTLNYTVAIETALVELHPDLNWAKNGDFIHSRKRDSSTTVGYELDNQISRVFEEFDPNSIEDARALSLRSIAIRQGQPKFRAKLLTAYSGRCAVTGTDAIQALEAAHISPYLGPKTNHVQNGMILRSDVHSLFDRGLLGVEPEDYSVVMSDVLSNSSYSDYERLRIRLPREKNERPNPDALWNHLETHDLLRFQ